MDVYHIGENARAFGCSARQNFPNGRIDGLLDSWLNVAELGGCKFVPAPSSITLRFPEISEQQSVRYVEVDVSIEGGATFPTRWNRDTLEVSWPPGGRTIASTMFPDAESLSLNPPP